MKSSEKQKNYAKILDILGNMKTEIVNDCTAQLMTTGMMPEGAQQELKVLSQVTGAVFNGLISLGTEAFENEENEGLVFVNIDGKQYSCAKQSLSNSVKTAKAPLSASEAYSASSEKPVEETSAKKPVSLDQFEEEPAPAEPSPQPEPVRREAPKAKETPAPFEELDEAAEFGEEETPSEEPSREVVSEDVEEAPEPEEEVEEVSTPAPVKEAKKAPVDDYDEDLEDDDDFETPAPAKKKAPVEDVSSMMAEADDDLEPDDDDIPVTPSRKKPEPEPEEEEEDAPAEEKSPSIAEVRAATASARANRENMFEEESSKAMGEMVYNFTKLSVANIGGGKPEEVVVMIAPLKIPKTSSPAVPIVVAMFNRGKVVCKTSYDMGDGGKAIVTTSINEMYFLCRGSFDENGKFKALITTTGISSNQGAMLNVISSKNYGNGQAEDVGNGHVKVRYEDESGQGTIEVFPFGTERDNEFIVLVKNPEFCDTYYVSEKGRGGSSVKIHGKDGLLEVVPSWNGDLLEVEVFEC